MVIEYDNRPEITVPNIINLNASNPDNAIWKPTLSPGYNIDDISIYDRWGNSVFYTKNEEGWNASTNGQIVSAGVYIYVVKYSIGAEQKVKIGDLTVVR